jgi:hypothetical protein
MNERIKELAEQCWDKRLDGLHFDQEKFAELIVRDCCPQRPWVGLTMLDMAELRQGGFHNITDEHFRAIEAKLRRRTHDL